LILFIINIFFILYLFLIINKIIPLICINKYIINIIIEKLSLYKLKISIVSTYNKFVLGIGGKDLFTFIEVDVLLIGIDGNSLFK